LIDSIIVPPAELESVLLQHPDIVDVAVIGIESKKEATELPRFVAAPYPYEYTPAHALIPARRAYVVHANPASLKGNTANIEFGKNVQEWIKTRVARHKFLRGGK
jgi:4-coumarate--CoA ligase